MKRKGIPKSIRFEVFKRDKFTCQYCGGKVPDVILQIDHIEPVSKGGDNGIINLITSCFECNIGKSDKKLSDNSAVEKQRKQMELLQERREQIELMFKWKKSLSSLDDETLEMIREYIEAKIHPFAVSDNGMNSLRTYLKKYKIDEVLDAIDVSATTYLKFSNENGVTKDSVEMFLDKLGGILFNRRLSPIEQKIAYVINNTKRNFHYFDARRGRILLNQYVAALRNYWHYSDKDILTDLENELVPKLNNLYNWTQWTAFIENWIESIKKKKDDSNETQSNDHSAEEPSKEWDENQFEGILQGTLYEFEDSVSALVYLLKPFSRFQEKNFVENLYKFSIEFLDATGNFPEEIVKQHDIDEESRKEFINKYIKKILSPVTDYDKEPTDVDLGLLMKLEESAWRILEDNLQQFYSWSDRTSKKGIILFRNSLIGYLKEKLKTHNSKSNKIIEIGEKIEYSAPISH